MSEDYKYTAIKLDLGRVNALVDLISNCRKEDVEIKEVKFYQNGFFVKFEDWGGDVILHDSSYGKTNYLWESYYFPWDNDDVSTHDSEEIAHLLGQLKRGEYKRNTWLQKRDGYACSECGQVSSQPTPFCPFCGSSKTARA